MKKHTTVTLLSKLCIALVLLTLVSCHKNDAENANPQPDVKAGEKMHTFIIDGEKTFILEKDGVYYFADDILLTQKQFNLLKHYDNKQLTTEDRSALSTDQSLRWTNGIVYYKLSLGSDNTYAQAAMQEIASKTPVRFIERTNQANYVELVKSASVNNSYVGMVGGRQIINLYNSNIKGIIMHEILHALGIYHEQSRSDRDGKVIINYQNIIAGKEGNFNKVTASKGIGAFDFGSIMIYGSYDFSKNNQPTITRLDGSTYTKQRTALSASDIAGIDDMY